MKLQLVITQLFFLFSFGIYAQTSFVSGSLIEENGGDPIIGANIYIQNAYDGTSTDLDGRFSFETFEEGDQILVVSYLGYEPLLQPISLNGDSLVLDLVLSTGVNELDLVVITAGAFEASDSKKAVVLRPLDIVTTAGATADIAGALNTLPGTQTVGEEGKLFVRGGAAHETRTFIDGLQVQNPYASSVPSIPARGRFSPFLFKGTTFSTGGYSAEYGQALSSALILETEDLAPKTVTGISLMTVGLGLAHTERWDSTSLSLSADYTNLAPYTAFVPQNISWNKPYSGTGGQLIFRHKTSPTGILKIQGSGNWNTMSMQYPNADDVKQQNRLTLDNQNYYSNASYREIWNEEWTFFVGAAYAHNVDVIQEQFYVRNEEQSFQLKSTIAYQPNSLWRLKTGAEYIYNDWNERFASAEEELFETQLTNNSLATFVESDVYLGTKWAARAGLRYEQDGLLGQTRVSPRLSLAFKTGKKSQVSLAYGQFYQSPERSLLRYQQDLKMERADHYILNYQILTEQRSFRIEAYWKKYDQLVQFDTETPWVSQNTGDGYAGGIDVFYRDRSSIKNGDFWLSYSFLDTERNYLDFPVAAVPSFASKHNFSAVYKHWIHDWSSNIGATYSFASPRPYNDPNDALFNGEQTKAYHDLSVNWSYLTNWFGQFTIVYASVTNVLGFDQQFGQRFSAQPNEEGQFSSIAIRPPAKRFFFVGVFLSLD